MRLAELQTPELILDRQIMQRNIARMAGIARRRAVPLRPHLKTPKCREIAACLQEAGAAGFCVSTLREAEVFFADGFDDLYYCVPFAPGKAGRAARLLNAGCRLTLMTDSLDGAQACVQAFERTALSHPVPMTLEIDVDGYRSGLDLTGSELEAAATALEMSSATRFAGLMSYAGASYAQSPGGAAALTAAHCETLQAAVTRLKAIGIRCAMISLGSTPALLHATALPGITEARCGIYVFQDLFQAGIGACRIEDIALSVLTSVTGCHPEHNRLIIDAGALALSKDRSTADHSFDAGYGWVCEARSGERIGDLWVGSVSQELGLVTSASGAPLDFGRFPIGTQLRILPNHADMTAAAYDAYRVVDGSDVVVALWERANRW